MGSEKSASDNSNKNILVLTSTFPRWDADTEPMFVYALSKNYVLNGFKVDVIAPGANEAKSYEKLEGINIYRYQYFVKRFQTLAYRGGINANLKKNKLNYFLIPFFFVFQANKIIQKIKSEEYDLIHAHWLIPQTLICVLVMKFFFSKKPPILCTSHGGDLYSLNGKIMNMVKKWTVKNITHLCVVSETMKNDCMDLVATKNKVSVLPMGVELKQKFVPSNNIQRRRDRIIFVGRFVEKKGISVLIDAMTKIKGSVPSVELILVGDGPLRDKIKKKIKNSGLNENIKFYGGVTNLELPELYSSATVAVVPSVIDPQGDREGLGLVTIEAMGCGCAVIASALEPIKEVIEHGQSGLLFKPGDAEGLARHIINLLEDKELSQKLSSAGREKVVKTFDWELIAENYCRLIHEICSPD